jgi:hypothetical protein
VGDTKERYEVRNLGLPSENDTFCYNGIIEKVYDQWLHWNLIRVRPVQTVLLDPTRLGSNSIREALNLTVALVFS